ncbi:MAG TPA: hypothetical protein VEM36_06550, partial [Xanthobacteraceae bacterium]|nr:hypothetical protein [Xanthobacteraceae bacterium]
KGGFALGETDPETGRRKGEAAGTELAMHATVAIDDLNRFLAEPEHPGGLSGTIDFPPFGLSIPAGTGVFNLFNPGGQPGLKLMVYELAFEHGGKPYYIAGRKEVRDDGVIHMWRDTTTLYTRLHGGSDANGPVAGAGTLSLGVSDLIRMLGTTQVTNATSPGERAAALARFGRFFLGQLWDTYGPHLGRAG